MANEKRTIQSFFAPVAKKAKPVAEAPAAAGARHRGARAGVHAKDLICFTWCLSFYHVGGLVVVVLFFGLSVILLGSTRLPRPVVDIKLP